VIGTLGFGTHGALQPLGNTTPDALELQWLLKELRRKKTQVVAMEVSSHGLVQGRVNGISFDCALFTNLSHDHLDYHGSMEAYAEAKGRLFDTPQLEAAVLNLDDVVGVQLARRLGARGLRTIGYSLAPPSPRAASANSFAWKTAPSSRAGAPKASFPTRSGASTSPTRWGCWAASSPMEFPSRRESG
jgi:UDP-N-acetylmuramoyl-L-alanyl-D-glutamate--2,6-diaminopimelate ligase